MVAKIEHHIGGIYLIDIGTYSQSDLLGGPVAVYSVPADQMVIGVIVSEVSNDSAYGSRFYISAPDVSSSPTAVSDDVFGGGAPNGCRWFSPAVTDLTLYLANTGPAFAWPGPGVDLTGLEDLFVYPVSNRDNLYAYSLDTAGTTGDTEPTWVLNDSEVVVDGTCEWVADTLSTSYSSGRLRLIVVDIP